MAVRDETKEVQPDASAGLEKPEAYSLEYG